jgi:hypothetical protein
VCSDIASWKSRSAIPTKRTSVLLDRCVRCRPVVTPNLPEQRAHELPCSTKNPSVVTGETRDPPAPMGGRMGKHEGSSTRASSCPHPRSAVQHLVLSSSKHCHPDLIEPIRLSERFPRSGSSSARPTVLACGSEPWSCACRSVNASSACEIRMVSWDPTVRPRPVHRNTIGR